MNALFISKPGKTLCRLEATKNNLCPPVSVFCYRSEKWCTALLPTTVNEIIERLKKRLIDHATTDRQTRPNLLHHVLPHHSLTSSIFRRRCFGGTHLLTFFSRIEVIRISLATSVDKRKAFLMNGAEVKLGKFPSTRASVMRQGTDSIFI